MEITDDPILLGAAIRALRFAAGLSEPDFAGHLHVSAGTVSRWEKGVVRPQPHTFHALQEFAVKRNLPFDVPAAHVPAADTGVPTEVPAGMKFCPHCYTRKRTAVHPLAMFGRSHMMPDGRQVYCRACNSEDSKQYRKERRERDERQRDELARIAKAGMSSVGALVPLGPATSLGPLGTRRHRHTPEYERFFRIQDGKCAICRLPEMVPDVDGTPLPLTLYRSGKVSGAVVIGLLCRACATALMFFRDSAQLLARAIAFLTAASDRGTLVTAGAALDVGPSG